MIDLNLKNNSKHDRAEILVGVIDQVMDAAVGESTQAKYLRVESAAVRDRCAELNEHINEMKTRLDQHAVKLLDLDNRTVGIMERNNGFKEQFISRIRALEATVNSPGLLRFCRRLRARWAT